MLTGDRSISDHVMLLKGSFFQMSSYARAYVCIAVLRKLMKKTKGNFVENIMWSEMGKQNVQA